MSDNGNENNISEDGERAIKSVAKGGGIVFIGLIFSRIFEYLYRMVIARYLGPSQYGLISLGMAVVGFAVPVAVLGLHQGVKRYISHYKGKKDEEKIKETFLSGLYMAVPMSILVSISVFLSSEYLALQVFHEPESVLILKIFALSIPFQAVSLVLVNSIEAFQEMKYSVLSKEITGKLSKIVLTVVLIFLGFQTLSAAYAYIFSFLLTGALASYFLVKRVLPDISLRKSVARNKRLLLSYSWPLLFTGILTSIIGWTDVFMLGYFKTSYEVGLYNAALPTAILLITFLRAINRIIFPVVSELLSQDKVDELARTYKTATKWIFSLTFPTFLLMVFFAPHILRILFGKEYTAASIPLSILAFAYFLNTSVGSAGQILKAIDKTRILLFNTLLSASLNVILNIVLIPVYGLIGAALATGTSIITMNLLMLIENYYFLKIHPYKISLYKPFLAAMISTPIVYYIIESLFNPVPIPVLIIGLILFTGLYSALFLVLGGIEQEDLIILKSIEKKSGIKIEWLRSIIKYFIR